MTDQQQPEPEDEQADDSCIVVILTDGTVLRWPSATTAFEWDEDGYLSIHRLDPETGERAGLTAAVPRGQWATAYEDGDLAS